VINRLPFALALVSPAASAVSRRRGQILSVEQLLTIGFNPNNSDVIGVRRSVDAFNARGGQTSTLGIVWGDWELCNVNQPYV